MSAPAPQVQVWSGETIGSSVATGAQLQPPDTLKIEVTTSAGERVGDAIDDIRSIYGEPSVELGNAVTLLTTAVEICREAIAFEKENARIKADSRMVDLQAIIAELFAYRRIGDGFSAVIAALIFAFVNKSGLPFKQSEMFAVLRTINSLLSAPYCSMESAAGTAEILDEAGLVIDPRTLSDVLCEAQEAGHIDPE